MSRKILVVDDNAMNRLLLNNTLCNDYDIIEAKNGIEALSILNMNYKVLSAVLLDIIMPEADGYDVLREMKDNILLSQIPVIMVTSSEDEESKVKALSLGANDFIIKPFNPEIVRHCVKNNIALRETASILNVIQKDKLTGLYNREAFFEKASAMTAEHEPGYYILSCFDIDNFKLINDQYGAIEGDRILREIGKAVKQNAEEINGIAARISADNFAALFPAEKKDTVVLKKTLDKTLVFVEKQPISFSIGRYVVTDLSLPASALYDRAFIAKQSIKGRYDEHLAYFDDAMLEKLVREQQITSEMETALKACQFEAWFQPQYNHSTGSLLGAEALARWIHPQKGIIPPIEFIPLFEQNGFVYELDKYIWRDVCKYLRKWINEGRELIPISVNISRYDIFRADLIDVLTGLVEEFDIPVDLLRLEITESAFTSSSTHIVNIVKQLISLGFTVEIDDFGSGYSSLNTLKNVPAQVVKLDMQFLDGEDDTNRGGNILESIVRMTKWLGMTVLAEGVEEAEQADFLKSIGCSYVQGYLYARPMPASEFEQLLDGVKIEQHPFISKSDDHLFADTFWDSKSIDSLVFNKYSGGACVYEFHNGQIEMIRVTDKYIQNVFGTEMTVSDAMKIDWSNHIDSKTAAALQSTMLKSYETKQEVTGDFVFLDLPGCKHEIYLRSSLRVIASTDDRYLVYCTSINITEQHAAEQKGIAAIEQLQLVLANIDSSVQATVFEKDKVRIIFANDNYYLRLGYTKAQYEKENPDPFSFIHPDDRDRVIDIATKSNIDKQDYSITYRLIQRDGKISWSQSRISFISFPGEDLPVQLAVSNDITAIKEAEEKSASAMGRLKAVMDNVDCGITAITYGENDIEFLMINDKYFDILGYSREEFDNIDAFSRIYADDRKRVMDLAKQAYVENKSVSLEFRAVKKDGSIIWMRDSMTITSFDGIDKPVQLSIFADITSEREATNELLDNLPDGAVLYEFNGINYDIIHINKKYWELVNRVAIDCSLVSSKKLIHPDDRVIAENELNYAISQNLDFACDLRIRYGKNEYRPFHVKAHIVPKSNGRYLINTVYTPISDEVISIQEMLPIALRAVMDSSSEVTFVKDKNLRYISCSRRFAELMGYSSESEMLGKSLSTAFPPELTVQYEAVDQAILKNGKSFIDLDMMFPTLHGTRHLTFSKYPLLDANGNVLGVYGTGYDVTEARETKSRLELIANSIPGGIAIYEGTLDALEQIKLVYFSDGFCHLFGYTREEYEKLAEVNPLGLVFSADIPKMYENVIALVRDGIPMDFIYRAQANNGSFKWIHVKALMGEPNGSNLTVNAVFFDVTEQKNAAEKLRVSEEINRIAIQHSRNVVCQYDAATRRLFVSPSVNSIFNISSIEEDVPYKPVREGKVSPDTAQVYTAFYESILLGEKSGEVVFQRMSSVGWRWVEAHFTTIYSDMNEPVSAVISFFDVTESIEKDAAYKKWIQSIQDRDPQSYSLYHCNVTKNIIFDSTEGLLIQNKHDLKVSHIDERISSYVEHCVFSEDSERLLNALDIKRILKRFDQRKRTYSVEYREIMGKSDMRWLKLTVDLIESAYSNDVEAYLLFENIDKAKRIELEIIKRAETDPLTGIYNRKTFVEKVEQQIFESRHDACHALLMLDLDEFKLVNDEFGHAVGDQVLIDIALTLSKSLRKSDITGRLGGDEFLVFLSDISDKATVEKKAQQICDMTQRNIGNKLNISTSIGIALYPQDGSDFKSLYKIADEALYYIKGRGKNSYAFRSDMTTNE